MAEEEGTVCTAAERPPGELGERCAWHPGHGGRVWAGSRQHARAGYMAVPPVPLSHMPCLPSIAMSVTPVSLHVRLQAAVGEEGLAHLSIGRCRELAADLDLHVDAVSGRSWCLGPCA